MPSTSTRASASMCLTAWNEPMGLPNCTRSLAYCTVSARTWSAAPSISALASVAARSTSSAAASSPPRNRAGVPSKDRTPSSRVRSMAGSGAGRPSVAQVDPVDPAGGQDHGDVGRGRVGDRRRLPAEAGLAPGPGDREAVGARGGGHAAHRVALAERLPPVLRSRRRPAPRPRTARRAPRCVGRNGAATRRRPISSQSTASSTMPRPRPLSSSGSSIASHPCSAMADQTASS